MAVSIVTYTGDGSTTSYAITFDYISRDDVVVTVDEQTALFTFVNDTTINLNAAPASGAVIEIRRVTPANPLVDFTDGSTLFESDLDLAHQQSRYLSEEARDIADDAKNTVDANIEDITTLADISTNVSLVAAIWQDVYNVSNISSDVTTVSGDSADISALGPISADIQLLADIQDGTIATNAITNVSSISGNINTVSNSINSVNTVASYWSEVNSVGDNIGDVQTLADLEDGTVATNALSNLAYNLGTLQTVSGNITNIQQVASNISNINLNASNIGDINTVAGISPQIANVGSAPLQGQIANVDSISADVSNVSAVRSQVSNVSAAINAGILQNIDTNLGAITNVNSNILSIQTVNNNLTDIAQVASDSSVINTVAAAITDVSTVSSDIASVITAANDLNEAVSEIETVAASITNVDLVGADIANVNSLATNLSSINTAASNITSINTFSNVYRIGSSDPTTSLDAGDLFYNTTSNTLKIYTGTAWEQGVAAGSGFLPISGGTLTGALSGTDASFSGSVTLDASNYINWNDGSTDAAYIRYYNDASPANADRLDFYHSNTGGGSAGYVQFYANGTSRIIIDSDETWNTERYTTDVGYRISAYRAQAGAPAPTVYLDITQTTFDAPDNFKILLGTGDDLELYHNATNSIINNKTGDLQIQTSGSTTLTLNATGIDVTGDISVSGTVDGRDVATDGAKLDNIEANADVTDTANVTAAGALMDSEVTNLAQVKAFDSSDYATAAQGTAADAALPKAGGTMTGTITFAASQTFDGRDVSADGTKLDGIESGATADQTAAEIKTAYESNSNTNAYTDAEKTKLSGIETGATADQTASEILTLIKTVDGAGSGLDADTLDGISSGSFLRSDASDTTSGVLTATDGMISEYIDLGTQGNRTIQGLATRATIGSSGGYGELHLQHYGGDLHTVHGGGTLYANGNTVWHAGNDGSGSGLDADTVDGIQASSFLRSDADDTMTGKLTVNNELRIDNPSDTTHFNYQDTGVNYIRGDTQLDGNLQINSHVINMDLNNIADNAIEMVDVRSSTWPFEFNTYSVGNDNPSGFWVGSNGYPDMRLRRDDATVRALISSWEESYVSNGFRVEGNLTADNATFDNGTSTLVDVVCDNGGTAGMRLYGPSQGTGYVEVGQSTAYGGGMYYNGDGSPAFASGETADTIGFYRLNNGTRTEVFSYPVGSDNVTFNGSVTATSFSGSGSSLTSLPAGNLTGTIPDVFSSTTRYNIGLIDGHNGATRDKLRVWNSSSYTIGMSSGYTFGGLNNDYAMSFQMNDDNDRGFWWGDVTHTNAAGAMSLTTNGRLTVAEGMRIGYGQTDTTIPSNQALDVNGTVTATAFVGDGSGLTNLPGGGGGGGGGGTASNTYQVGAHWIWTNSTQGAPTGWDTDASGGVTSTDAMNLFQFGDSVPLTASNRGLIAIDDLNSGDIIGGLEWVNNDFISQVVRGSSGFNSRWISKGRQTSTTTDQHYGALVMDGYFGLTYTHSSWQYTGSANMPGDQLMNVNQNGITATAFNVASDIRLKENLAVIPDAVDKVSQLNGYSYTTIDKGTPKYGVVAQEVEVVMPHSVQYRLELPDTPEEDLIKTVDYPSLIPLLIEAIKEQQSTIEALEARSQALEARSAALEARVTALEG